MEREKKTDKKLKLSKKKTRIQRKSEIKKEDSHNAAVCQLAIAFYAHPKPVKMPISTLDSILIELTYSLMNPFFLSP